ncbi:hypothetical protein BKA65DRAFT_532092 [Rhexocercosporidium sp. MPI-PUGE-AT-0058]|nr:hypothetical protein BKA65DRAFT_532092 [Rhexocercosporidium sp. MPI-PUGE-AT-0058]
MLPGNFNRSIFDPPWLSKVDNPDLLSLLRNEHFIEIDSIAFDPSFFSLIGPTANISRVITFPDTTSHESSCYIPSTNQPFFATWGFSHSWQYVLDGNTNELHNITTSPPTWNAHGCVHYDGFLCVATDGGMDGAGSQYASIVEIDPRDWSAETLINNFYKMPFLGFHDLDVDRNGNIWVSASTSAWGRYMTTFAPQTTPAVYFINTTTLVPKWVFQAPGGNTNGIAISSDFTLYISSTDISSGRPNVKDAFKDRQLMAYDTRGGRPQLRDGRMFRTSVNYYCDGVRVSRSGLVWCAMGDGVDVLDEEKTLGRIRTRSELERHLAVNLAFGREGELWVVGRGGVWSVTGIREELRSEW